MTERTILSWAAAALILGAACADRRGDDDDDDDSCHMEHPADAITRGLSFGSLEAEIRQGTPPPPSSSTMHILPVGGEEPLVLSPGATSSFDFRYEGVTGETMEVIIYFQGGDSYIVITVQVDPDGEGTVIIPFEVTDDVAANLYDVIHSIQCNETLQGLDGGVADYLVQTLTLSCPSVTPTPGDDTSTPEATDPPPDGTEPPSDPTATYLPISAFLNMFAYQYCGFLQECDPDTLESQYGDYESCVSNIQESGSEEYTSQAGWDCLNALGRASCSDPQSGEWRELCLPLL